MKELLNSAGTLIYMVVIPVISPLLVLAYGCTRIFLFIAWLRNIKVEWSPARFHHLLSHLTRYGSGVKKMLPSHRRLASVLLSK
jgi:hypothetical protein